MFRSDIGLIVQGVPVGHQVIEYLTSLEAHSGNCSEIVEFLHRMQDADGAVCQELLAQGRSVER